MIEKVISGGQSGVDQAGWRAAKAHGLPTGGWMPPGFLTDEGPRPDFAVIYGAREHVNRLYLPRTEANVREADATLWLGREDSRGYVCPMNACRNAGGKPIFVVTTRPPTAHEVVAWIGYHGIGTLNIAGNREGAAPGIGERAEAFLSEIFALVIRERKP